MNPTNGQVTQTGGSLQPQASQTQTTASNFQTGGRITQDSNESSENLLNQGAAQSTLSVVSSPTSTTPVAVATANSPSLQSSAQSASNGAGLALILIGAFIVVASVTAWNRYVKTPIPVRSKRR
jgi:hypothetical protein